MKKVMIILMVTLSIGYAGDPSFPSTPCGLERGTRHVNGGGFVSGSSKVSPSVYVDMASRVCGGAQIAGEVMIKNSTVFGSARIWGSVRINNSTVSGKVQIVGKVFNRDLTTIITNSKITQGAVINGGLKISNSVIGGEVLQLERPLHFNLN